MCEVFGRGYLSLSVIVLVFSILQRTQEWSQEHMFDCKVEVVV